MAGEGEELPGAERCHSGGRRRRREMVPLPSAPPRLLLLPSPAMAMGRPTTEALPSPASPSQQPQQPRKRQRLAHLSPEEKALRRKLKNRVAAQSARDRKKARMGELERQAIELEAQNQRLSEENRRLREEAQGLASENQELRLRLAGLHPSEAGGGGAIIVSTKEEDGGEGTGTAPGDTQLHGGHSTSLPPPMDTTMGTSGAEPGVLVGLLEGLDPALFLLEEGEQEEEVLHCRPFCTDSIPVRGPPFPALGPPERGLEAPDGPAIRADHPYTKPLPFEVEMMMKQEEAELLLPSPLSFLDAEVEEMMKQEEAELPLLPPPSPSTSCFLEPSGSGDDSDFEGNSPFTDFAAAWELFPQLVTV